MNDLTEKTLKTERKHTGKIISQYGILVMVVRQRRSSGAAFYGCRKYPSCKGIVNIAH